jgi:hypothetical protein
MRLHRAQRLAGGGGCVVGKAGNISEFDSKIFNVKVFTLCYLHGHSETTSICGPQICFCNVARNVVE